MLFAAFSAIPVIRSETNAAEDFVFDVISVGKQINSGVNIYGADPIKEKKQATRFAPPTEEEYLAYAAEHPATAARIGASEMTWKGGRISNHTSRAWMVLYRTGDFEDIETLRDSADYLMSGVSNHPYWGPVYQYRDQNGDGVGGVTYKGYVNYNDNTQDMVNVTEIAKVLAKAVKKSGADGSNDYYHIMLPSTVGYEGACTDSCAYHQSMLVNLGNGVNKMIYYSVILSPGYCDEFNACSRLDEEGFNAPNGDPESDTTVPRMAKMHAAMVTNADGLGYSDATNKDIGQLCMYDFGNWVYYDSGLATINVNERDFYAENLMNPAVDDECTCNVTGCYDFMSWFICTGCAP